VPPYAGPVRDEPLAVELHNTLYVVNGEQDGLADAGGLRAWLGAIADRLPVDAKAVDPTRLEDFASLRAAVREALHASLEERAMSGDAVAALNTCSAASPQSVQLRQRGRTRDARPRYHGPSPTDIVLGVIAADAIALAGGSRAGDLRVCGRPGCVLMFVTDHPRREWCSPACGNRVRQARHYARHRRPAA
jgi:predicted RNA-binding Zn ribbon-like protein